MEINQRKAGAALSYLTFILGLVVSLAYTPIMLRALGQSEYGLYNIATAIIGYLGMLNFGFNSTYIRYYTRSKVSGDKEDTARLNGMFLIIFSVIGLIAAVVGTILILNINLVLAGELTAAEVQKTKVLIAILIFNLALSLPASVFSSNITANERFVFLKSMQLIRTVVTPLFTLPLLFLGHGSVGMVVITTIVSLGIDLANIIFCKRTLNIGFIFRGFDFRLMKEMTVFSSFIFINIIIDQINWNVDKYILGKVKGSIAVAVYGVAAQLKAYFTTLSTSISEVFTPKVNKIIAKSQDMREITHLFVRVGRIQFIILSLAASGMFFFGKPFILMWAGTDYADSYLIMLLLVFASIIPLTQNTGIEVQRAKNMHKFRSLLYLSMAVFNVALSIPLARLYSGAGTAFATALSIILGNGLAMNIYYHKKIGLNMKLFWKNIISLLPSMLFAFLIGTVFYLYVDLHKVHMFLLCGILYVIAYAVPVWLFGMNSSEKELIIVPMRKIGIMIQSLFVKRS